MSYLVICEKNSVMRTMEECYRKRGREIEQAVGAPLTFCALSGHVCRYKDPDEYPQWEGKKWSETPLPLIPEKFEVVKGRGEYIAKVLKAFEEKLKDPNITNLIVATDPDQEGAGIFLLLALHYNLKAKFPNTLRFYQTSLTDDEITTAFREMQPFWSNPRDIHTCAAFVVRSRYDWVVGFSATRAMTLRLGFKMRVGRVKAPTVKLVYMNSLELENWRPSSLWNLKCTFAYDPPFSGILIEGKEAKDFATKEEAQAFIDKLKDATQAKVTSIEVKRNSDPHPYLFMLSTLQAAAGSGITAPWGYKGFLTPSQLLDNLQILYENGLVSYPRTQNPKLSSKKAEQFPGIINSVNAQDCFKPFVQSITPEWIERAKTDKRIVDDVATAKESHDAIIPTTKPADFSKLTEEQKFVYWLIARQFLSVFYPPCVSESTTLMTDIKSYPFKSTGVKTISPGWRLVIPKDKDDISLPETIHEGDMLNIAGFEPWEKKAKPPARLTEATLISAMEHIDREIAKEDTDDEEKRSEMAAVMKEAKGIGTPATRAEIIKALVDERYMTSTGKNHALTITDAGKTYIESMGDFSIIDPMGAAEWESKFAKVRHGEVKGSVVLKESLEYAERFCREAETLQLSETAQKMISKIVNGTPVNAVCPFCGTKIQTLKWGYACEASRDGKCRFKVSSYEGKIKAKDIETLVTKKQTRVIKNIMKSPKTGNYFDAALKLNDPSSTYLVGFAFPERK